MNHKILMGGSETLLVWDAKSREAVGITDRIFSKQEILASPSCFRETEFIFSTWGMPSFTEEEIRRCLPSLRAVFYAAGTVQSFARPILSCGVKVFSARSANAVPVAEYTLAQILLANKGYFSACRQLRGGMPWMEAREASQKHLGNYGATVGVIGCGMIGQMVLEHLRAYHLRVKAYDAFLSDEQIRALGAEPTTLEDLFAECDVVSNHLANVPATVGMLTGAHFASMKQGATFINTGRGATVRETELIDVLQKRPDLCALLDVADPEPPQADSPLRALENVFLTPHISGSQNTECARMAAYMAEEYHNFKEGKETRHEVQAYQLDTMA